MTTTCTSISELKYVEDNTRPEIVCTYTDSAGAPIPITGFLFELHIAYETPLIVAGSIVDALNGIFKFGFIVGDLKIGKWEGEIQIDDGAGGILTFQGLMFDVKPKIA